MFLTHRSEFLDKPLVTVFAYSAFLSIAQTMNYPWQFVTITKYMFAYFDNYTVVNNVYKNSFDVISATSLQLW